MRSWLAIAALFAIVVALGAWIYRKPTTEKVATYPISTLRVDDVKQVRFERQQGSAAQTQSAVVVVLERQADGWRMSYPLAARTDSFQVERLLSILNARASARYPAGDLARYGLDAPHAHLTLNDQTFLYGTINKTTREQYVATGNAVYVVPLSYSAALPRNADLLLAHELLGKDDVPVRFQLRDFSVSNEQGHWISAPAEEGSADDRVAWVDAWRHANAVRVLRHDGRNASERIRIELKNGRSIDIGVLQREPEVVLVRFDENVQYRFFGAVGKRLLARPGVKVD